MTRRVAATSNVSPRDQVIDGSQSPPRNAVANEISFIGGNA
jgi:hypothetical protein